MKWAYRRPMSTTFAKSWIHLAIHATSDDFINLLYKGNPSFSNQHFSEYFGQLIILNGFVVWGFTIKNN